MRDGSRLGGIAKVLPGIANVLPGIAKVLYGIANVRPGSIWPCWVGVVPGPGGRIGFARIPEDSGLN